MKIEKSNIAMLHRRAFLRSIGVGALAYLYGRLPVWADGLDNPNFDAHLPADKGLKDDWIKSLFARGTPQVFSKDELRHIQMPISGICTGQELNLSGEGSLAGWRLHATSLEKVAQGFALRMTTNGKEETHLLGQKDFPDMTFRGEYPIAKLEYANGAIPIQVSLEAFSPYIPLETDDSGLPATIFHFTLKNTSANPVETTLAGCWENAVCDYHRHAVDGARQNRIIRGPAMTVLNCSAAPIPTVTDPSRPDIIFEDWKKATFTGWKIEGDAFGRGPVPNNWPFEGAKFADPSLRYANSFISTRNQAATGKLTSALFTVQRDYIRFYFSGGDYPGKTCVNLLVDNQVAQSVCGRKDNQYVNYFFDVKKMKGRQVAIEIVDDSTDYWGYVTVGAIVFSDISHDEIPMEQMSDYGTMAMALIGKPAELGIAKGSIGFDGASSDDMTVPLAEPLIGTLGRTLQLNPCESSEVTFVLAGFFPNLHIRQLGPGLRYYTTKFNSAQAVVDYVATNLQKLTAATRLWRDTWYDSTLPFWFLDRTFVNASTPASGTCYRVANGRFYAYEGAPAPSYEGTCIHVWQYAHSLARTFPELERDTRERVDLGSALDVPSGVIGARGEAGAGNLAIDGQAGTILRFYREHQMSPDDSWLKRNWDRIKLTFNPLFAQDLDEDGILEGRQNNTLDCAWFGQISWMSSEYCAAVRAGEAMAREMGDDAFALRCAKIADAGAKSIPARLFNGEYFYSIPDPKNPNTENSGDGSYIDQVYGQGWAFQVGLPRILPEKETRLALANLWKYNFSPDAFGYFNAHRDAGSAQYVNPGDAGMIMCTFPRSDWDYARAGATDPKHNPFTGYFVDTWTGQEYQVAGHMLWEGMVQEGLAIVRAIHDRYHPSKRNPWQEQEAGVHYSRAMASHGTFIGICGYEYHGPKRHLGFAPKLTPENFRAPFTAAEGWGTFAQTISNQMMEASVEVQFGQLKLQTFHLTMDGVSQTVRVTAKLAGIEVPATIEVEAGRVKLTFTNGIIIQCGQKLSVKIA
jgi:non-lysosomal glucosylceramidase